MRADENQRPKNTRLYTVALMAFCLAIVVVVLGAFTRLVDAGLGCPDWPGCYGHLLWPNDADEIARAEQAFPGAPVETDKTWPEMVHRYFAGALGLCILSLFIIALSQARQHSRVHTPPLKHTLLLLCVVIVQAAFGMWTVTLTLWPQVVTAHLLGGFTTLSLLWLLVQRLGCYRWSVGDEVARALVKLRPLCIVALVCVLLQIALGGWLSANYAALACPDFPRCLGQWLPPADFRAGFNFLQAIGPNYLGGELDNQARTAIHLSHRLGALLVLSVLLVLGGKLWRLAVPVIRPWVIVLWLLLGLQLALGISNIVLALPLFIALAHHGVGAVLFLCLVTLLHRVYTIDYCND
ncbi:MAG: COX15/CtaA family protein [Cellvibrionaceae bacterium]|nr:COX15/CtaA family protein [Cellvibrionaceae bacterium]